MVYYLIVCPSLTYAHYGPHPPLAKDDFRGGV